MEAVQCSKLSHKGGVFEVQDQSWFLPIRRDDSGAQHHQSQANGKNKVRDLSWTMVGLIEQPGFSLVWLAVVDVSQSV